MNKIKTYHRFIDEAGDTTFCNSKGEFIIGNEGVSKSFGIGMLKIKEPINDVRNKIITKQKEIENDKYVNTIPSVKKRIQKGGFFFHCSKDVPEIRMIFYNFINSLDCSFEMIVARKLEKFYNDIDHNFKESSNFYSEILGHLLKNKLQTEPEMILYIAERGKTTSNKKIEEAITKAKQRYKLNPKNKNLPIATKINFMVKKQSAEPILNIVDYLCWAVQRVFEKGETRYYDFIKDKINLVVDLYDTNKYENYGNYYWNDKNPLTKEQLIK
jgi:hypothetical protein